MARYLSDEWFSEAGAAASGAAGWSPAPTGSQPPPDSQAAAGSRPPLDARPPLVLEHLITASPEGDICYHVCLSDAGATIVRGPASEADVTFTEDYATAAAVASGSLSAAAALLAGRIRVAGNVAILVEHQPWGGSGDPLPAAVRAATTY